MADVTAPASVETQHAASLPPRAAAERQLHNRHMLEADFDLAPFTIAWEVTRACAFA
nr:hypothetical protein [Chloroflexota bacterium]